MNNISKNEVIELLKKGFKPNIIEFEFDVSSELMQEYINEYNKEMEKENLSIIDNIKQLDNINTYKELINEIKNIIKKAETVELTVDECIQIINYLRTPKKLENENRNDYYVKTYREYSKKLSHIIKNKLFSCIDERIRYFNDVEQLKQFEAKVKKCKDYIDVRGIMYKIDRKIQELQQKKVIEQLYSITPELSKLISQIADGTLDIEQGMNFIEQQAQEEFEKKQTKNFAGLTLQQEKEKIIMKIISNFSTKSMEYPIKDVKATYEILKELTNNNQQRILNAIVRNYINRKEYKMAMSICLKVPKTKDFTEEPYVRMLEKEIEKAASADKINISSLYKTR